MIFRIALKLGYIWTMAITVPEVKQRKKAKGAQPLVMVTAYDAPGALILAKAGVDILLVGDSVANTVLGFDNTLSVTIDIMCHHVAAVKRSGADIFIVADMPWLSYHLSEIQAIENAAKLVRAGADAVKLEGGQKRKEVIRAITHAEIPVMGHIGLTPQSINVFGGYKVQGKGEKGKELLQDAKVLEEAGCFAIVLEVVPASLGKEITESVSIPTIGIGAGPDCDGQVLVFHDLLGLNFGKKAKFVRQYENLADKSVKAIKEFAQDVRTNKYPTSQESY